MVIIRLFSSLGLDIIDLVKSKFLNPYYKIERFETFCKSSSIRVLTWSFRALSNFDKNYVFKLISDVSKKDIQSSIKYLKAIQMSMSSYNNRSFAMDPLRDAAFDNNENFAKALVKTGWPVDGLFEMHDYEWGFNPLLIAANHGYLEVLYTLVEHGANVNIIDPDGNTPLGLAIDRALWDEKNKDKCLLCALVLLKNGANVWQKIKLIDNLKINIIEKICMHIKVDGFYKILCALIECSFDEFEFEKRIIESIECLKIYGNDKILAEFELFCLSSRDKRMLKKVFNIEEIKYDIKQSQSSSSSGRL